MKIVAIIGSANTESNSKKTVQFLIKKISILYSVESIYFEPSNTHVEMCVGAKKCFEEGKCVFENDDINRMLQKIQKADILIIATPIYFKNVSGFIKILLDRLSYVAHLMPFAGTKGIIITTSSSNAVNAVNAYLFDVFTSLGVSIVGSINLFTSNSNYENVRDKKINLILSRLIRMGEKTDSNIFLEKKFSNYKKIYLRNVEKNEENAETTYWKKSGFLNKKKYQDVIDEK